MCAPPAIQIPAWLVSMVYQFWYPTQQQRPVLGQSTFPICAVSGCIGPFWIDIVNKSMYLVILYCHYNTHSNKNWKKKFNVSNFFFNRTKKKLYKKCIFFLWILFLFCEVLMHVSSLKFVFSWFNIYQNQFTPRKNFINFFFLKKKRFLLYCFQVNNNSNDNNWFDFCFS